MHLVLSCITVAIVAYTIVLFLMGTAVKPPTSKAPDDLLFVFMVPCLNEELVIGRTIERLEQLETEHDYRVMVIDDGSEDRTADVVRRYGEDLVWLFQRTKPEAQQGKGEALNAAYRYLRSKILDEGRSPDSVIVVVLDADGRLESTALDKVAPFFADPDRASVQIKVRIHNAPDKVLARLQDIEFASFTEVFQRARSRFGSAGLGGNGQFARLTALMSLGDAPWSDCLTEDLELGIEFLLRGWKNDFCPDAAVSQQGVTEVRKLVRQRARWFQGHLQCLKFIPRILRSDMPMWPRLDLVFHLVNSVFMLVMQSLSAVWLAMVGYLFVTQPALTANIMFGGSRWLILYALAFGLAPFIAVIYWRTEPTISIPKGIALAHLYVFYSYLWWAAGLQAVYRMVTGKRGWAKTARTVGTGDEDPILAEMAMASTAEADLSNEQVIDLREKRAEKAANGSGPIDLAEASAS